MLSTTQPTTTTKLFLLLLLSFLTILNLSQCNELVGQSISIPEPTSTTSTTSGSLRSIQSIQAITANDGGNSQNNGTFDNGLWSFYGSQQAGTNTRSEKTYLYSLYVEKTVHVLTNWARMSPVGFKTRFSTMFNSGVSLSSTGGLVPLFEHFNLVESARYHSYDMSYSNCFQHNSCNGEDTFARIKTFYNKNVGMAENIAAGQTSPLSVTMAWINSSGHRANILGSYTLLGVGFFGKLNGDYSYYWTQNFASGTHGISNPIVSASHIILTSGQLTFLANYYHKYDITNNRQVKSVQLFIEDNVYSMTVPSTNQFDDKSANGMGTYEFTLPANTTATAKCRKYYIKAIDSNGFNYYYPSFGYLLTQDENVNCKQHYLAVKKSSDVVVPTPVQSPIQPKNSVGVTKNGTDTANNGNVNYCNLILFICCLIIGMVNF